VVDEQARRVADAVVTVWRDADDPCLVTRCDDNGSFAFDVAPDDADCTRLRARGDGRLSSDVVQRDDMPGREALTIEVTPRVALYGHVADEHGRPVHGAIVATGGRVCATTDPGGGYRLDGLQPGRVHLHAWRNGLQLQTATVLLGDDTRLDWTLPPARGRWIRFTLADATPAQIRPRWSLTCHHPIHMGLEGGFPESREVTLGGLPTEYQLQGAVWSTGLVADPINHWLEADPREGLVEWCTLLAPAARQTVSGIVVDEHGERLSEVGVLVRGAGVAGEFACTTDANGRFVCEFDRAPNHALDEDLVFSLVDEQRVFDDRDHRAWGSPRCRGRAFRSIPSDPEGELVLRTVPAAGVRGRVIRGGEPVRGAVADLMLRWSGPPRTFTSRLGSTETGADGEFAFVGLHAAIGDGLFVRVRGIDVHLVTHTFALREGATEVLPELVAGALATVRGRLVHADGAPAAGRVVSLLAEGGLLDGWDCQAAEAGADGSFAIHHVRPGRYSVGVHRDVRDVDAPSEVVVPELDVSPGEVAELGDVAL